MTVSLLYFLSDSIFDGIELHNPDRQTRKQKSAFQHFDARIPVGLFQIRDLE